MSIARRPAVLILRLSALGDVIHTLPAVVALRESLSHATFGWVVESAYRELVERVAPVERVFAVATRKWRRALTARTTRHDLRRLRRDLREFAHDGTSIDFQGLVKSAILGVVAGAASRYGFESKAVRERASVLLTNRRAPIDRALHVVEWNLQLARAAGARATQPPRLDFSRFEDDPTGRIAEAVRYSPIVINPATGRTAKNWSIENFAELARGLQCDGRRVMVLWGPGEEDLAAAVARAGECDLAPPTNLRELAFLLRRSRMLIAGDTGPLHLAAGLGTDVVGIYGPTDPRRNGPWGQLDRCVESFTSTRDIRTIQARAVIEKCREILR